MEFKYLSNGKKVVVVGQLNNVESIVQEVFVTESGDEIPSGEKFTTKSLHDEPVVSWQEKREGDLKASLKRIERSIEKEEQKQKEVRSQLDGLRAIFKQSKLLSENLEGQDLDILVSVMSGTCEFLVIENYGVPRLVRFEKELADNDEYGRFESLKLISLMGRSDGSVQYNLNRYSDGSGCYTHVHPCNNMEEARLVMKRSVSDRIEKGRFPSISELEKLNEIGVVLDGEDITKIQDHMRIGHEASARKHEEEHQAFLRQNREGAEAVEVFFASAPR